MDKILCFLTGGHRYADENITVHPNKKKGYATLKNYCVKCQKNIYIQMNLYAVIPKGLAEMERRK